MTYCDVHASGAIDLYFYGELESAEHQDVTRHVRVCSVCRQALEELAVIREALETRPDVSAPASGDWTAFMTRLDAAIGQERVSRQAAVVVFGRSEGAAQRTSYTGYLAMAALLALVSMSVLFVARNRGRLATEAPQTVTQPIADASIRKPAEADPTLTNMSEQHFERSKLVLLGLATKDTKQAASLTYERDLAGPLLNDTRLYRMAAEDRGMTRLAGVLRDLELVLLQTSMTDEGDPAAVAQLQRLIRKRDLLGQMDTVTTATTTGS
jgi:hypothetical protein